MTALEHIDREADEREYQAKLRVVTDRCEAWVVYYRQRNRIDGPSGTSVLYKLAAEAAEEKRREKRDERSWICVDCGHIHPKHPDRCGRCGRRDFIRGQGVAGKRVSAALIHSTAGDRDWTQEMETDAAIRAMPGALRNALKAHYLDSGTQRDKARFLGIGESTYRGRIALAYQYLIGYGDKGGWFDHLANR